MKMNWFYNIIERQVFQDLSGFVGYILLLSSQIKSNMKSNKARILSYNYQGMRLSIPFFLWGTFRYDLRMSKQEINTCKYLLFFLFYKVNTLRTIATYVMWHYVLGTYCTIIHFGRCQRTSVRAAVRPKNGCCHSGLIENRVYISHTCMSR